MCIGFGVCQMPVKSLWPLTSTKSLIKHCLNYGLCITLVPYNWLLIHHGMLGLVGVIYQSEVILTLNLTFDPMIVKPHLILVLPISFCTAELTKLCKCIKLTLTLTFYSWIDSKRHQTLLLGQYNSLRLTYQNDQ